MDKQNIVALVARQRYLTNQIESQALNDVIDDALLFDLLGKMIKVNDELASQICELMSPEYMVRLRMRTF